MSVVNDLRKYGFHNGTHNTLNGHSQSETNGNSGSDSTRDKIAAGRKRIRHMSDSSDDEDAGKTAGKTSSPILTIRDKEKRLIELKERHNDVEAMLLQDALVHSNWEISKAEEYLKKMNLDKHKKYKPQMATYSKQVHIDLMGNP